MKLRGNIRLALDATGKRWSIESGTKHYKVVIDGRLAGILPHGRGDTCGRGMQNLLAQIRRAGLSQNNA